MRVLLCSNFYYRRGGDCTYLLGLQKLLEAHGHETAVFSMRHPQNLPCAQEKYFVDFLDYAELNRRKNPVTAARVLARSIWSRQARKNIARLIAKWKPDVAHFQNIHAYLTPSIIQPLKEAGVPIVWTLHDYKLLCPDSAFLCHGRLCEACVRGHFWHCAAKRCKKGSLAASAVAALEGYAHRAKRFTDDIAMYVSPSQFLREKFVAAGFPAKRMVAIHNFLPAGSADGASGGGEYGLYLGTFLPIKGVATLLRALAKAPSHSFHLVGDGPERAALEQQVAALGLGDHVRFCGFLTGEALQREIAGARYAAVPSEWLENFPYSVMELLATGKPVIGADIGGIPELLGEGRGYLFPAGDAEALAGCIGEVLANPEGAAERGERGRAFVRAECDPEKYYGVLSGLYAGVQRNAAR